MSESPQAVPSELPSPLPPGKGRTVRPRVILTHGIRTEGRWIPESARHLDPFFELVPFYYGEFKKLGAVKLVVEPWLFGLTLVLVLLAAYLTSSWPIPALVFVAGLAASRLAAVGMLRRVLKRFLITYHERAVRIGTPPHVVAHSLGTYFVGRAFQRHPTVHFSRLVLCASILRRDFKWERFRRDTGTGFKLSRFDALWNEVGLEDAVPIVTEIFGPRFRFQFGGAGRYGFVGSGVHQRPDHYLKCTKCRHGDNAPVHNVESPFTHSEAFYGSGHCRDVWLPFLLGYDPAEYAEVMRLCAHCLQSALLRRQDVDIYESELRDNEWDWCGGQLSARVHLMLVGQSAGWAAQDDLNALVDKAVGAFWARIGLAQLVQAGTRHADVTSDDLDLHLVLQKSIDLALK